MPWGLINSRRTTAIANSAPSGRAIRMVVSATIRPQASNFLSLPVTVTQLTKLVTADVTTPKAIHLTASWLTSHHAVKAEAARTRPVNPGHISQDGRTATPVGTFAAGSTRQGVPPWATQFTSYLWSLLAPGYHQQVPEPERKSQTEPYQCPQRRCTEVAISPSSQQPGNHHLERYGQDARNPELGHRENRATFGIVPFPTLDWRLSLRRNLFSSFNLQ
jgi:hypothetical protein